MSVNKVELELRLIDLVRDHPYLYDKSHPTYRDIKQKELTWAMIAQQLDMSGSLLSLNFFLLFVHSTTHIEFLPKLTRFNLGLFGMGGFKRTRGCDKCP